MSTVSAITPRPPLTVAGFPLSSWAFAVRIWIAAVLSLLVSFWLQLETPFAAMVTVMILAEPTRGQALEKAGYRLIATAIGVVVSIVLVGSLSQTRDLLLVGFAAWMGLCVYACGLLDGYRAYAAGLSGYTVALIAIQQIDNPLHVFETAMDRGATIVVGVLSITLVNDLLFAPDRHPQLGAQLAALHRRVRSYAQTVIRGEAIDALVVVTLMKEIVALRADVSSLASESSSGPARGAAARSAMVALVAQLRAVRALAALSVVSDAARRKRLVCLLDWSDQHPSADDIDRVGTAPIGLVLRELLRRDDEVRQHLSALGSAVRPSQFWRAPLFRPQRFAIENGVRAVACVAVTSALLVQAGWTSTSFSLALISVVLALGATTPAPRTFTTIGALGAPIAIALTGVLEFFVLDGASDFPLLAVGLAPFMIGAALFVSSSNPVLSGLGKVNLIFISVLFAASNPQAYNPQAFLFTAFFLCVAIGLLLAGQYLIPPVSDAQRRCWLLASARHELERGLNGTARRYAPEEATFRDAVRVGQIASGPPDPEYRTSVEQALTYFDQAAAIRFGATETVRA